MRKKRDSHPLILRGTEPPLEEKNYPVRTMSISKGERIGLDIFPNFHKSGSTSGMKKQYYGKSALLVKSGNYIYKVTKEIYDMAD